MFIRNDIVVDAVLKKGLDWMVFEIPLNFMIL